MLNLELLASSMSGIVNIVNVMLKRLKSSISSGKKGQSFKSFTCKTAGEGGSTDFSGGITMKTTGLFNLLTYTCLFYSYVYLFTTQFVK